MSFAAVPSDVRKAYGLPSSVINTVGLRPNSGRSPEESGVNSVGRSETFRISSGIAAKIA